MDKLNDLEEPSLAGMEETWGLNLDNSTEFYTPVGRGGCYTSKKGREIANCLYELCEKSTTALDLPHLKPEAPCHDPLPVGVQHVMQESNVPQEVLDAGMENTSKLMISQQSVYLQNS